MIKLKNKYLLDKIAFNTSCASRIPSDLVISCATVVSYESAKQTRAEYASY